MLTPNVGHCSFIVTFDSLFAVVVLQHFNILQARSFPFSSTEII